MQKAQVEAVVEALEQEYDSPEAAAKAIYALCVDLYSRADTWGIKAGPHAYGPCASKAQAKSVARHFGLGEDSIKPLYGLGRLALADTTVTTSRRCPDCDHPKIAHFPKTKANQKKWDCLVDGCKCRRAFKEGE
jgi:hypothetical protein